MQSFANLDATRRRTSTTRLVTMVAAFLIVTPLAGAQQAANVFVETDHYRVVSEAGRLAADETAIKLEAALELINDVYHFDLDELPGRMRVRILPDKARFDAYLDSLIDETRDDFVYIHYSDVAKSELVGFVRDDDEEFDRSLIHLGSIQALKTFIPEAPIWLREGVAAYLENSAWDDQTLTYSWRPNLVWLDTLKQILRDPPLSLNEILTIDADFAATIIDEYYPQAWGLVHFLNESDQPQINRLFWDAISALDADATLDQNSRRVIERAFAWIDRDELQANALAFVQSLHTFFDWVQMGIDSYGTGDLDDARTAFESALKLESDNYVPYYYLGLIAYAEEVYDEAETHYRQALAIADDQALVFYALGVNAFADNRFDQAEEHLVQARALNTAAYGDRVDTLLDRIQVLR